MKLPNLEKALTKRAGSLESLWKLVQGKGSDSFIIHEEPYLPFTVEAQWHDSNMVVWAFFCKNVNGDTCMDPLVKYQLVRTAEGGLDFTPFYWETFPFPPCRVIEGESSLKDGTIKREELEEFVRDWDVEFGNRGYANKVVPASSESKDLSRDIPNTDEIGAFLHCGQCLAEKPEDRTLQDWARLKVGWTKLGLQVWCTRHDTNVVHIDFEGNKHPANVTVKSQSTLN